MLEIKDLHVNYGAVHALNGVSMTVKDGESRADLLSEIIKCAVEHESKQ